MVAVQEQGYADDAPSRLAARCQHTSRSAQRPDLPKSMMFMVQYNEEVKSISKGAEMHVGQGCRPTLCTKGTMGRVVEKVRHAYFSWKL